MKVFSTAGEDTGGNTSLQFTQGLLTLGGIKKYAADEDTGDIESLLFTKGLLILSNVKTIWWVRTLAGTLVYSSPRVS